MLMKSNIFFPLAIAMGLFACKVVEQTAVTNTEPENTVDSLQTEIATAADTVNETVYSDIVTYRGSNDRLHDLIHTKLEVSLDWSRQQLVGVATLELRSYFYEQDELTLDAKGFAINNISLVEGANKKMLKYTYDGSRIVIALGREYESDEHFFVEIDYIARPDELQAGGSEAIGSDKGLYFINPTGTLKNKPQQIWTQGETEANSVWFPTIDSPNERATQEFFITVDNKFTTLSNGSLIYSLMNDDDTRTDYWKLDQAHAPYLAMMAIGEFAKVEDHWEVPGGEEIEVNYYVEEAFADYARNIFGNTPEMLDYFSKLLNYPYPWPKYSQVIVHDFVSGAMENTTASVFMEDLLVTDKELLDYHWDDIIAHELFHHWFGNLVTCESWSNLPLNEAFATYGEYLWYQYKFGEEEADYHQWESAQTYLEEAKKKQVDLIRFTYEDKEDMFDHHSYDKGGLVLHMLRNYVGDKAFFKSLELYLKEHAFGTAEIHDLRMSFEEVTGEDLNWFFNQWFLASGHPRLEVSHYQKGNVLTVEVKQNQDLNKTPVFNLPVVLGIWVDEEKAWEYPVEINASYEKFEFEIEDTVRLVLFDAEQQLLAEVSHPKTADEFIFQYYNGGKLLARYNALEKLGEIAFENPVNYQVISDVFLSVLNDPFWALRDLAIDFFDEYDGEHLKDVVERLIKLAESDPKPQVRASAVTTLASIDPDKHKLVIQKALNDPSYTVKGAAILGFSLTTDPNKTRILTGYKDSLNTHITLALADYFVTDRLYEQNDWFLERLNEAETEDLFYLVQYYGMFMSEAPDSVISTGVPILEDVAKNNQNEYIRLAAFQSLNLLPESDSLVQIKNDIKAAEQSEELLNFYREIDN